MVENEYFRKDELEIDDLYIFESDTSIYPYTIAVKVLGGWRLGSGYTIRGAYFDLRESGGNLKKSKPPFVKGYENDSS